MPRLKKLAVDISSRRFVEDRASLRTTAAPVFYAGETQDIELSISEKTPTGVRDVLAASGGQIKVRLGTTTTLVASSVTFTYDPPALVQATGTVTTVAPVSIPLNLTWALAPTAPPALAVNTQRIALPGKWVTPGFVPISKDVAYNNATAVTATFTSFLQTAMTFPAVTLRVATAEPDPFTFPGVGFLVEAGTVTFGSVLNTVQAATFTVTTTGSSVASVAINVAGTGYPDGTHNLVFTGGTVTSVAEATCVASGGAIVSVTIVTGGNGYVTAPAATLFTPAKRLQRVDPNEIVTTVNGRPRFYWHHPLPSVTAVTLNVGAPDNTSTPPAVVAPVVLAQYVETTGENLALWEVNIATAGYGYTTAPAVTVPPISVSSRRRVTVATLSGNTLSVSVQHSNTVTASAEEGSLFAGSRAFIGVVHYITRNRPPYIAYDYNFSMRSAMNGDLSAGNFTVTTLGNLAQTPDGRGLKTLAINLKAKNSSRYRQASGILDFPDGPVSTLDAGGLWPITGSQTFNEGLGDWGPGNLPTRQSFDSLYGRSYLCAVAPVIVPKVANQASVEVENRLNADADQFNELAPERYALVRVTFPPLRQSTPDYYVNYGLSDGIRPDETQTLQISNRMIFHGYRSGQSGSGNQPRDPGGQEEVIADVGASPGGGFWEPTIEFLDYGKGYKTKYYDRNNIYKIAGYYLRSLGSLAPGATILTSPVTRSVTAVTVAEGNYYHTQLSTPASVTTRDSTSVVEYVVEGGNFGYTGFGSFQAGAVSVATGGLSRVVLNNQPRGYNDGSYPLVFSGGSPTVTASGQFHVNTVVVRDYLGRILNKYQNYTTSLSAPGSGYATAPTVTVQGPQAITASTVTVDETIGGNVYHVRLGGSNANLFYDFSGYPLYRASGQVEAFRFPLQFEPSPVTGGTAEGYAIRDKTLAESTSSAAADANPRWRDNYANLVARGRYQEAADYYDQYEPAQLRVIITNPGYGYVTPPAVTLAAPVVTGYRLTKADFAANFGTQISDAIQIAQALQGAGVTVGGSVPAVSRVVTRHGLAYGTYPVEFSGQPSEQGQEAVLDLVVAPGDYQKGVSATRTATGGVTVRTVTVPADDILTLRLNWRGAGYAAIPTATPPSASGFIISAVSVASAGYYYDTSVSAAIVDPTGQGAVVAVTEVAAGKVQSVSLAKAGYGYSASPQLVFTPPAPDPTEELTENGLRFTITVATSAAASVLKTSDDVAAQLEIYEENQTEQAVIAQIPVRLAKRVKET